jgi:hypothetical protein
MAGNSRFAVHGHETQRVKKIIQHQGLYNLFEAYDLLTLLLAEIIEIKL